MGSMVITGPSEEQKKADEDRKIEKKKENEKNLQYVFLLLSTGAYKLVRDYYIRVMELSDEELVIHELVL